MAMKVRDVLSPLLKASLQRLCLRRELPASGRKNEILKRLSYSYHGDLQAVLGDLRKVDLLTVANTHSTWFDFPDGLWRLTVVDLRKLLYSLFTGNGEQENAHEDDEAATGEEETQYADSDEGTSAGDILLYSSRFGTEENAVGSDIQPLKVNSLIQEAIRADRVTVLSAYYVPDLLRRLLGGCKGEVRLVLNGLGGKRLDAQVQELQDLQGELGKSARSAAVRLAFSDGIFHTKLYLFETGQEAVVWIGSANATEAGLNGHNEEILLRVSPAPSSVVAYVKSVWARSACVEACRQPVNSLSAFFRTGTLYYKPHATLIKTYNPFREFLERLPQEEKSKIAAFRSDFADDEAGIGAFNLDRVFKRLVEPRDNENPPPNQPRRVDFRRHAIQTCYGYWVPDAFTEEVDLMLEAASVDKLALLHRWREWMAEETQSIVDAYSTYLSDVKETLEQVGVEWRKYAAPSLFKETSAIERPIEALVIELSHDHRLQMHAQAFVSSELPEIWEDAAAREAFENSFFDALAAASSARRRSTAAKLILDALGSFVSTAKQIRQELLRKVRDPDWYERHFHRTGDDSDRGTAAS